jgi:hydroxymethyl cephem carbamoyltransferase
MSQPGSKFAALFAICDPTFPGASGVPRLNDAGKLMALAAYASADQASPQVVQAVDRILTTADYYPFTKADFSDTPLYNCGVESEVGKAAAAVISNRIFSAFADAAVRNFPPGLPLRVSGGCGLNCDWNSNWVNLKHFSEVFVPPCANDTGSAIGTGIDALSHFTGDSHIDWDVYSGLTFNNDCEPSPHVWDARPLDLESLAADIRGGAIVAWVQGRWEIGPRALGNRSLLAEPFRPETRDRLNAIKNRETYRPIAPCARLEDLSAVFVEDFEDPFMLYFRRVADTRLRAITHVDGSARCQTVSRRTNARLHELLTAFAGATGVGVLCNTSLNFSGAGFINSMSDLSLFCERQGVDGMVVGDVWFQRRRPRD